MKRLSSCLLLLAMLLTLVPWAGASQAEQPAVYSSIYNSGTRNVVCTSLSGTGAAEYYTGSYSYGNLAGLDEDALLQSLRALMTDTHIRQTSYSDCRDYAVKTDCQAENGMVMLIYTGYEATRQQYINNTSSGWNREHIWPKSLGGFNQEGPGADLHHIRPSDSSVNGTRGNLKYGEVENGKAITGTVVTENALGGYSGSGYFEPLDNVKGDIARICLYMYVRYGGNSQYTCSKITTVFQSVDVLLEWMALDPVDTWEMGRNEVAAAIQGNRNVFIDYPELAWQLFGQEAPEDLITPSGGEDTGSDHIVDTVPATGPAETGGAVPSPVPDNAQPESDWLWIVIILVVAAGAVLTVVVLKKRKKTD